MLFAIYVANVAADLGEIDLHAVPHVGSDACKSCHADNHRSFARTFHGRMTREATDETVLGDFDDAALVYGGVEATMTRGPAGEFRVTVEGPGFARRTADVVRTVGSHRYQQYLARHEDLFVRLPVAWDPRENRWFHMNGAFLTPDPPEPQPGSSIDQSDYDRHVVRWNDNCVFCHNVAPNPGRVGDAFETEVAELGVACEACHGPGSHHVAVRASRVRSFVLDQLEDDPSIVSPEDLSPRRSADVCGRCHGQRKTEDLTAFMTSGDPFVPGDDLSQYSTPLNRTTTLDGNEGVFRTRFWSDGTPRLTAYAYQGLLASPCAERGELTCTTCHGMHEGDPDGQLRPEAIGDGACVDCHTDLGLDEALVAHTRHQPRSARCIDCHMPRIVYGLVGARISHRIENPSPRLAADANRPDACTLCHVDESRLWARRATTRLFGLHDDIPLGVDAPLPEVLRALFGGDPIERAVAAEALGQPRRAAREASRPTRLGALFDVMREDPYPAVRHIAWRSARRLADAPDAPWTAYVPEDGRAARIQALSALYDALPEGALAPPAPEVVGPLREAAATVAIHIGE